MTMGTSARRPRTLILYATHEINDNVAFFCQHGFLDDERYQFVFIINDPELDVILAPERGNVRVLRRENVGLDFGAWGAALKLPENGQTLADCYDYYIFLNCTVRGPFLPVWFDEGRERRGVCWPDLFLSRLNETVKLVGTSLSTRDFSKSDGPWGPHLQSMFLATDHVGLRLGLQADVFAARPNKLDVIRRSEVGFSAAVLAAGYNLASMLAAYRGVDFRVCPPATALVPQPNHRRNNHYYGINIHPYEVVFFKENRDIDHNRTLNALTAWHNKPLRTAVIDRALYGVAEDQAVDVTEPLAREMGTRHVLDSAVNLLRLGPDPFPGQPKNLFLFTGGARLPITLVADSGRLVPGMTVFLLDAADRGATS